MYTLSVACSLWLITIKIAKVQGKAQMLGFPHSSVASRTSLAFTPAVSHRTVTLQRRFLRHAFSSPAKLSSQVGDKTAPVLDTGRLANDAGAEKGTRAGDTGKIKNPWKVHDAELLHRAYSRERVPSTAYDKKTTEYDYIIVGSGIGGLWLAACLAKFNRTSLVLEQHYTAGGLQHEFTLKGYEFVPGLHYIANLPLVGPMYEMVATQTDPPLRFMRAGNCTPADRGECCSHDLAVGDLPVLHVREGLEQNRRELLSVFPNETEAIDKFLSFMEKAKYQSGIFSTLKMLPSWLHWIMSQILCSSYIHTASRSTEEILSPLTKDGRLHTVLSLFAGDLGESLRAGSFAMQAAVMGHVIEGCYYPESGPAQLVRGLVPTIRVAGGDVLVQAPVREIIVQGKRAIGVRLGTGDGPGDALYARRGVVSDAGFKNTLENLLPEELVRGPSAPLRKLHYEVTAASEGGIGHCFGFVGLNASAEALGLRSSSFYYLPWNATDAEMDATCVQDFYRDTLLDPNVLDVSAGWVFVTAKDPYYSKVTMPGKTTVVIFSEAKTEDFDKFVDSEAYFKGATPHVGKARLIRKTEYEAAKELVKLKMMRGLLRCFPHLEPHVEVVEIGTPLSMLDYTHRMVTLGLRHNPRRLTSHVIRPDCAVRGLYFTGQDVCFAGWAGAMAGAVVTAQLLLGYNIFSLLSGKTLMRDLGAGDVEELLKEKMQKASKTNVLEVAAEMIDNAIRHVEMRWLKNYLPR